MEKYYDKAIELVRNKILREIPIHRLSTEDLEVTLVWFTKTLQNWKAIVITNLLDDLMYEVTYDGNKKQTYIDTYHKIENVCIPDEGVQPPSQPTGASKYNVTINDDPYVRRPDPYARRHGVQIGDGNYQKNVF
jgi:hypothetical protein